ncbi:MAG TPA: hypothetical protein DEH78_21270 [Solibacterales bacterium]|nr:hypothetical protein [Bryobacterales bacterium]
MNPPRIAVWLLRGLLAAPQRDWVEGDLAEEFAIRQSRAWYWRQVVWSAVPLVRMQARAANWEASLLAVFVAAAGPVLLLDGFWSLILSQVPLKAGVARGMDYLAAGLWLAGVAGALAGFACRGRRAIFLAPLAVLFALLALGAITGVTPFWYRALITATLGAGVAAGAAMPEGEKR